MDIKNIALASLLIANFGFSAIANEQLPNVQTPIKVDIAKLADAQVFAELNDAYPAVINYFTSINQAEIIRFYVENYGEVLQQELKRERLTLNFNHAETKIRVIISKQNNKQQVDVLIEKI